MATENKYIFMITFNKDNKNPYREICIHNDRETTNNKLYNATYIDSNKINIDIYHGTLLPATFIPNNFKGIIPYLVIYNPLRHEDTTLANKIYFKKQSNCSNELVSTIQNILKDNSLFKLSKVSETKITINDIFIFLGCKTYPKLHIPYEAIDEELVERIENIVINIDNNMCKGP